MAELLTWKSFWCVASPEEGAIGMLELYGERAADAAASCADAARADDRDEDYSFWTAVLAQLRAVS